jgi:hypothetical protein
MQATDVFFNKFNSTKRASNFKQQLMLFRKFFNNKGEDENQKEKLASSGPSKIPVRTMETLLESAESPEDDNQKAFSNGLSAAEANLDNYDLIKVLGKGTFYMTNLRRMRGKGLSHLHHI